MEGDSSPPSPLFSSSLLLLGSSRSLALCSSPLFPASLPTEDCDCEGYFNGQYIGERVHISLLLPLSSPLLPLCSVPAAAWLGGWEQRTDCRVHLLGEGDQVMDEETLITNLC